MSHYPSSAELASFRRSIPRDPVEIMHPEGQYLGIVEAWPDELSGGIGYSGGSPTAPFLMHEADGGPFPMGYAVSCAWADAYDHSWARKAAGAMRSRAFRSDTERECVYGCGCRADRLLPQSTDQGVNVTWQPVCVTCAPEWWDGADWFTPEVRYI